MTHQYEIILQQDYFLHYSLTVHLYKGKKSHDNDIHRCKETSYNLLVSKWMRRKTSLLAKCAPSSQS